MCNHLRYVVASEHLNEYFSTMVSVSIVMPLYNGAETVLNAIESVQKQSFDGWELIIVDDASTDDSQQLAADQAAKDARITVYRHDENKGAAQTRNTAIKLARGRYISFLDADDRWASEKLSQQLAFMQRHQCALSFTAYSRYNDAGKLIQRVEVPEHASYEEMLRRNHIGCLTAMYDSEITGKVYMPDIMCQHDYALWLQIVRKTGPARGLNIDLAYYRENASSLSSNKIQTSRDMWHVYRSLERLPFVNAARYFASYAWYGYRYRIMRRQIKEAS